MSAIGGGLRRGARPGLGRHQFDRLGRRVLELLLRRRHRLQQREPADPARRGGTLRGERRRVDVELIAATDALTIVVNPEADWIDLTVEELAQIWEEDPAQTWDEVRDEFPNEEIERFGAADTSGTYDYFIESILEERGHTSDYQATEQDNSIAQGVSGSEYAIGYFGFAYFQNPDQLKALGIDDGNGPVEPSLETASSGEYTPLSRPLFTYPSIESLGKEHVAEFARYFVEQTTNEDLVAGDVGYVPATEETQEEQMEILEDAIERAQE